MQSVPVESAGTLSERRSGFVESLGAFARQHRAKAWQGDFGDFLTRVLPTNPAALAPRSSFRSASWIMDQPRGAAGKPGSW